MSWDRTPSEPRRVSSAVSLGRHRVSAALGANHPRGLAQAVRIARGGQLSIRSTFIILLAVPLISLLGLWVYLASGTAGAAFAERNADTVNKYLGTPTSALYLQLDQERTDTFIWQGAHGRMPRTQLDEQRAHTNSAIAAFTAAARAARGAEPAAGQAAVAAVVAKLGQIGGIRAKVNAGTLPPLAAFQAYNDVIDAAFPISVGALTNPDTSIAFYEEGLGVGEMGQALEYIDREATLMGGALVAGDQLSIMAYRQFLSAMDEQRFLEQVGQTPIYWQQNPDPYPPVFASAAYARFAALEDKVAAAGPGARLPVSATAWQDGLGQLVPLMLRAEVTSRQEITSGATHQGDVTLLRLILVGGAGLVGVLVSAALLLLFGRRITRELTALREAARTLAQERLPALVRRLRAGEDVNVDVEAPPLSLNTRTREVTETASAFSAVRHTAVEAAAGQAQLRKGVNNVFRSLARRNQALVQRQLKVLDELEAGTEDPEALAQLFRLDHLTTRMRRQAEGLIILSGAAPGRGWPRPVPIVDVLRAAIGEIEDYVRVDLQVYSPEHMIGAAVADVTHLLAELIENAALYSPPDSRVQVRASGVASGFLVEIADSGLGVPSETLAVLNTQLAGPLEFDLADSDRLGLFVVSRLAARRDIKVALRDSAYGTVAAVLLPPDLLASAETGDRELGLAARVRESGLARPAGQSGPGAENLAPGPWPLYEENKLYVILSGFTTGQRAAQTNREERRHVGTLEGKVAFITGAARGQGRSHAVRLASEGADIIAVDICETFDSMNYPLATPEDLAQTVKDVEALDRRIVARQGDVRVKSELKAALDAGLAEFGRLDIVVANAGVTAMKSPTPAQAFIDGVDVDLQGVLNAVAVTVPHLTQGSSIIVTGSTAGLMKGLIDNPAIGPGGAGYAWAKRTIASYVEAIALQLAPHMIRVNAIHPTNVNTMLLHNEDIYRAFRPDLEHPTREDAEAVFPVMQAMPIPYIEPSDVSELVAFLASDKSRYLTGMNIRLDAGAMLKGGMSF